MTDPLCKDRGVRNAYVPESSVRYSFELMHSEQTSAQEGFRQIAVERWQQAIPYRLAEFVRDARVAEYISAHSTNPETGKPLAGMAKRMLPAEAWNAVTNDKDAFALTDLGIICLNTTSGEIWDARGAGIFDSPEMGNSNGSLDSMCLGAQVRKTVAANSYFNISSGHKVNGYRKRKKPKKGRSGSGFSFKPEIPWTPAPAIVAPSLDIADKYAHLEEGAYPDKYERHSGSMPNQTIPKVEWAAEREWRNRSNRRRRAHKNKMRGSAKRLADMRKEIKWFSTPDCKPPKHRRSFW